MDTYEYPLGVKWRATTPEHAAARAFGRKRADYLATVQTVEGFQGQATRRWVEVTLVSDGSFVGDIPISY